MHGFTGPGHESIQRGTPNIVPFSPAEDNVVKKMLASCLLWFGMSCPTSANEVFHEVESMIATGTFEVDLTPQADTGFPAGRMVIDKTYSGDVTGTGVGQMISKRAEGGTAVYFAVEEFSGSVNGKKGGFTLLHEGRMTEDTQTLHIEILESSGSGELSSISGSMKIIQDSNGHTYELVYAL